MSSIGNEGGGFVDYQIIWKRVTELLEGMPEYHLDQARVIVEKAKNARTKQDEQIFLCELGMYVRSTIAGKKFYVSG